MSLIHFGAFPPTPFTAWQSASQPTEECTQEPCGKMQFSAMDAENRSKEAQKLTSLMQQRGFRVKTAAHIGKTYSHNNAYIFFL